MAAGYAPHGNGLSTLDDIGDELLDRLFFVDVVLASEDFAVGMRGAACEANCEVTVRRDHQEAKLPVRTDILSVGHLTPTLEARRWMIGLMRR